MNKWKLKLLLGVLLLVLLPMASRGDSTMTTLDPFKIVNGTIQARVATNTILTNLTVTGTCTGCGGGGGGSPAGPTNSIQYNDGAGNFAGSSEIYANNTQLAITGAGIGAYNFEVGGSSNFSGPIHINGSAGNGGDVLFSNGAGVTPTWSSFDTYLSSVLPSHLSSYPTGSGSSNYVARWTGPSSLSTGTLYDNGTNVGIGTSSPVSPLSVVGNIYQNGAYAKFGTAVPVQNCSASGSCLEVWGNDNTVNGVQMGVGNTSAGTSAYSGIFLNNDDNDGTVTHFGFIGRNSKAYNDTTFGTAFAQPNGMQIQNTDGPLTFIVSSSTPKAEFQFLVGGTATSTNQAFTIKSTGSVGIGTTSPNLLGVNKELTIEARTAGQQVAINMSGYASAGTNAPGLLNWYNNGTRIGYILMARNTNDTSADFQMASTNSGVFNAGITLKASGRFGIATTAPNSLLHVGIDASSTANSTLYTASTTQGAILQLGQKQLTNNVSGTYIGVNTPASFAGRYIDIQNNGTSAFYIDQSSGGLLPAFTAFGTNAGSLGGKISANTSFILGTNLGNMGTFGVANGTPMFGFGQVTGNWVDNTGTYYPYIGTNSSSVYAPTVASIQTSVTGFNMGLSFTPTNVNGTVTGRWVGASINPIFGNKLQAYNSTSTFGNTWMTGLEVAPTINVRSTSTVGYVGLLVNPTETSTSSQQNYLALFQTSSSTKVAITPEGKVGIGTSTPNANLHVYGSNAYKYNVLATSVSTYNIATSTDNVIYVSTTTVASTLTLPICNSTTDQIQYIVKDKGGNAGTNNITVQRAGSDTIDGATTKVINTNYGSTKVQCVNSGTWFVLP